MSFEAPALPAVARPIRSLIAAAQSQPPEVPSYPCVDPVETAADKLSALAWRDLVRDRSSAKDDPTIIRHLHDLAADPPVGGLALLLGEVDKRLIGDRLDKPVAK